MDVLSVVQTIVELAAVLLLVRPVGGYLVGVFFKERSRLDALFGPIERGLYWAVGVDPSKNMGVKRYVLSLLLVNGLMLVIVMLILVTQGYLPLNPTAAANMPIDLAFNTAASFTTNTNWQSYAGETQVSYLSQMICMTFLMFTSAATGMAVGAAFIRGFASRDQRPGFREITGIGNFYVDFVRSLTRVLVPFAMIVSILLLVQGVPQTLGGPLSYHTVEGSDSTLYRGPVASLESIKHLGTNGGGFFAQNSAHPFENPTPLTNVIEIVAMLVIPISLLYAFGVMTGNTKQGWILIGTLTTIFIVMLSIGLLAESSKPGSLEPCSEPVERKSGRQRGSIRHRELHDVHCDDDRNGDGIGEQHDRQLHGDRRSRPALPPYDRLPFCRRRVRPSHCPYVRDTGRIHSRPDGRT